MKRFLCRTTDVPVGAMAQIQIEGLPELVVANVDGTFYVLDDECSHGKASLAQGSLLGCEVECALHSGRFDLVSGRATRRPAKKPVTAYECVVEGDELYVLDPSPEASHQQSTTARTAEPAWSHY